MKRFLTLNTALYVLILALLATAILSNGCALTPDGQPTTMPTTQVTVGGDPANIDNPMYDDLAQLAPYGIGAAALLLIRAGTKAYRKRKSQPSV